MMKFYHDIKLLERKACEEYLLTSELLMENAAHSLANFIRNIVRERNIQPRGEGKHKLLIAAGPGNNGADGLALARILQGEYDIVIYMPFGTYSELCTLQFERVSALRIEYCNDHLSPDISIKTFLDTFENISLREWAKDVDIIVDALYGSGLNRPLEDKACEVIEWLNSLKGLKIACDVPSGIGNDGDVMWMAFRAEYSCVMGVCRESLLGDRAKDYVGKIHICSIGISPQMLELLDMPHGVLLEEKDLQLPSRRQRNSNSHKGSFGHLVVFMGQKEGAAILSALSAFRFGVGIVTIIGDKNANVPPEMVHTQSLPNNPAALAIGMGLGDFALHDRKGVRNILLSRPVLLDADILYQDITKEILEKNPNVILTPHPKEFVALMRLLGLADCEVLELQRDRFRFVRLFTHSYPNATLLLKGANPIIAQGNKIAVNYFGTPALAKAGSGDVLSGLVSALLAQGLECFEAAVQGSLAHTLAARHITSASYALTPMELIETIGRLE